MPCYSPLNGYYKREDGQSKFTIVGKQASFDAQLAQTSCGQCIGCKIQKAKDWGIRCVHEMQMHETSIFVTLTYENTPEKCYDNESLNPDHLQQFWKNIRKKLSPQKIKYYACGEYGSDKGRPHYHAIMFGIELDDRVPEFTTKQGETYYSSEKLTKSWGFGGVRFAAADIGTAIYISKYITKKHTGDLADTSYFSHIDTKTGEWVEKIPEFTRMSTKPAIGLNWLKKYYNTEVVKGYLTHEGTKYRVPKYYKDELEKLSPSLHEELVHNILQHLPTHKEEADSYERLLDREKYAKTILKQETRDNFNAN